MATQYADHRGGLTAQFHQPEPGTTGPFRASVHRGKDLFANRCANCHQPETPDLPLFRVTCNDGRAARAPYFTNGSAATVEDPIDSYQRLNIRFQPEEKRDLVNYLLSL